jgi:beta-glucosidase-like glycosyl hydrolase
MKQKQAVEGFTRAVHAGEISEQRLNESVKRILRAKSWLAK